MRNRSRRWLFSWAVFSTFLQVLLCRAVELEPLETRNSTPRKDDTTPISNTKEMRGLFSPRMDYEQWTPLGRGDPLKNDPTYDYVPPVLERVHYWIDPALRKPDPQLPNETQKTEILVLGVSSKKPSTGTSVADVRRETFDPFLKFVEAPKFNVQNNYQRRPHYPMSSPYFPSQYYLNKNKHVERPSFVSSGEQPVPNTMLMPPPMPTKTPVIVTTVKSISTKLSSPMIPTSTPSVSVDKSNLIYQSSSSSFKDFEWKTDKYATLADSSSLVTWKTPIPQETNYLSSFIPLPDTTTKGSTQKLPENYVRIELSEPITNTTESKPNDTMNIKYLFEAVAPLLKSEEQISGPDIMYKGQVTDGDMDIASTYVNIGKSEAQMDTSSGIGISGVSVIPPKLADMPPVIMKTRYPQIVVNPMLAPKREMTPMTLQSLQTMQTMQPPPVSMADKPISIKANGLHSLLQKEVTLPSIKIPSSMSSLVMTPTTSTTPSPTTTTTSALTTDPLFKHYKQPMEPIRGPMYLIIQGHSKVKTYGPAKQIHGISVQETNEIPTSDENVRYSVKHLHNYKKEGNDDRIRSGRSSKLQTLTHVVQTGLGAIDFSELPANRRNEDVQETELQVGYDVSARRETTSEKYYKGLVEAGDLARKIRDA